MRRWGQLLPSPRPSKSGSISSAHATSWLVAKPVLQVGNDRGRLTFQLMELVDLLSHARREFSFDSQILLQSFADFSTDCSAVGVINVDGVTHDGPRCPYEPAQWIIPGLSNPVFIPVHLAHHGAAAASLWRVSETALHEQLFAQRFPAREPREAPTRMIVLRLERHSSRKVQSGKRRAIRIMLLDRFLKLSQGAIILPRGPLPQGGGFF